MLLNAILCSGFHSSGLFSSAKFLVLSSGGIYLNIVDLLFFCSRRAVFFLFKIDTGLTQSAMASMASFHVFNFTMWPLRSSSDKLAEFFT